jgi:F420-non-reducing hydrogenase small subunit
MALKIAEEWLANCGGCEVTILDIGEPLLDLLPKLDFVHFPVLTDHKYFGQTGEKDTLEIPEAEVGIISGGIRNEEHKELTIEMRNKCKTLIALGSCACFGGIPALANQFQLQELYDKVYRDSVTTDSADTPDQDIPPLLDKVYALDEVVKIDVYIPGCPTAPKIIAQALTSLLEGKSFDLPERSVCDDCPVKREKKALVSIKRPLESILDLEEEELVDSRCFMEKGYLCLGPVTKTGCYMTSGEEEPHVPRCIKGLMPCRGCFGPIRMDANPMVDMMGAISSIGLNAREIPDRAATFNRYVGAQGRLRPIPKRN